jgi:hypothetical protein
VLQKCCTPGKQKTETFCTNYVLNELPCWRRDVVHTMGTFTHGGTHGVHTMGTPTNGGIKGVHTMDSWGYTRGTHRDTRALVCP